MHMDDFGRFADSALLIMISLSNGDKHGYAMMEDVEAFASIKLGPGTLYGTLSRLEARGWIMALESSDRRRPYRLTSAGKTALEAQLAQWRTISDEGIKRLGAL
jgi:DNA-binding PadR family transcriptional regulator